VHRNYPLRARSAKNTYGKKEFAGSHIFPVQCFFTPHLLSGSQILLAMSVTPNPVLFIQSLVLPIFIIIKYLKHIKLLLAMPINPIMQTDING